MLVWWLPPSAPPSDLCPPCAGFFFLQISFHSRTIPAIQISLSLVPGPRTALSHFFLISRRISNFFLISCQISNKSYTERNQREVRHGNHRYNLHLHHLSSFRQGGLVMQEQLDLLRLKLIERRGVQAQLDELNGQMSRVNDQMRDLRNRSYELAQEIDDIQQAIAGGA